MFSEECVSVYLTQWDIKRQTKWASTHTERRESLYLDPYKCLFPAFNCADTRFNNTLQTFRHSVADMFSSLVQSLHVWVHMQYMRLYMHQRKVTFLGKDFHYTCCMNANSALTVVFFCFLCLFFLCSLQFSSFSRQVKWFLFTVTFMVFKISLHYLQVHKNTFALFQVVKNIV